MGKSPFPSHIPNGPISSHPNLLNMNGKYLRLNKQGHQGLFFLHSCSLDILRISPAVMIVQLRPKKDQNGELESGVIVRVDYHCIGLSTELCNSVLNNSYHNQCRLCAMDILPKFSCLLTNSHVTIAKLSGQGSWVD